jgi:hypothetical protein
VEKAEAAHTSSNAIARITTKITFVASSRLDARLLRYTTTPQGRSERSKRDGVVTRMLVQAGVMGKAGRNKNNSPPKNLKINVTT